MEPITLVVPKDALLINQEKAILTLLHDKLSVHYIDTLNLSTTDIENILKDSTLTVTRQTNIDAIEKRNNFPSFVTAFYYYIYYYKTIPSQEAYIHFYYSIHEKWIQTNIHNSHHDAFKGRLSRTYPSLVRDVHFYHLLKETGFFKQVIFNTKLDLHFKIDILVMKKGKRYGLQLHTKTKNAFKYLQEKKGRTPTMDNVTLLEVAIDLSLAKNVKTKGESLKLYTMDHANEILERIKK